jgi:hypothetical protein
MIEEASQSAEELGEWKQERNSESGEKIKKNNRNEYSAKTRCASITSQKDW